MLHFLPYVCMCVLGGDILVISLYIAEMHSEWTLRSLKIKLLRRCTTWKSSIALLVEENIIVGLSIQPKLAVAIFLLQKNASNSSLLKLYHCKMSLV